MELAGEMMVLFLFLKSCRMILLPVGVEKSARVCNNAHHQRPGLGLKKPSLNLMHPLKAGVGPLQGKAVRAQQPPCLTGLTFWRAWL